MNYKTVFVDSHVHIYNNYSLKVFCKKTIENFYSNHTKLKLTENFAGFLLLTEAKGLNYFQKFVDNPDKYSDMMGYPIERTSEDNSLRVRIDKLNELFIISGHQIISSENLEVLSLGSTEKLDDGDNILDTIQRIKMNNNIPVVPWGVGKWFGKRGEVVRDVIRKSKGFYLGDNSGRPVFWKTPDIFSEAAQKKIFTLRGTDPLPIKNQEKKTASFGFYFMSDNNSEKPWEALKNYLNTLNKQPDNFGELESIGNFLKNQSIMQLSRFRKN